MMLSFVLSLALSCLTGCTLKKDSTMSLDGAWLFKIDSLDKGVAEKWFQKGYDRADWTEVHVPDYWDRYNLATYDGVGWFATTLDVPDVSKRLALFFGGVDDDADVWVNGIKVGAHVGYSERFYLDVGTNLRQGKNELVVRVNDHGGPGGIYKPVTLLPLDRVQELLRSKYADLKARPSADWVQDAVIYEIYLRSFSREGSLKALERRLTELKDLGVTVVWLMPIHPVGDLNRKGRLGSPYSVQDYYAINPEFGTLEDFKSLVEATHALGMKIIIDLVANHTSWDSKLVMEHPDWFTTDSEGAIVSPNPDWTDVADLNYDHHELRKYMIEMMKYWVQDVGIDGFRCDVAELVPTDFWDRARKELDKIKPVIMLSEGTLPEHHVEAFDLTYSWNVYDVLGKIIKGSTPVSVFDDILQSESYQFPKSSLRLRFNTNHDKNAYDAPAVVKYARQGAKATALLAFTFPGVPLIYNGEEVGNDKRLDLFDKVAIDWKKNPDFREFYRKLGMLRVKHAGLRRGQYVKLQNTDSVKVYSFARRYEEDYVVIVINFDQSPKSVEVSLPAAEDGRLKELFTGAIVKCARGKISLRLKALDFVVLLPFDKTGAP
jgi:glycosidase